jgi:hypothetical protein
MSERSPDIRASDADRHAVAERLRAAAGEGRLDVAELDERLSAAYGAKTLGELEPLTADLGPATPARASERSPARRNSTAIKWRQWAGVAIMLNAIWAITCVAGGELTFYWPVFPLGIMAAVNVAWMVMGGDDERRRRDRA